MSALARALPLLACPDDGGALTRGPAALTCATCARAFPVHGDAVVELMPRAPAPLSGDGWPATSYRTEYHRLFALPFAAPPGTRGWGDLADLARGHQRFVREERARVAALLANRPAVLVDVSAGAGTFFLELAARADLALHLDLDPASVGQVSRAARDRGLTNVLAVRCDYLAIPLRLGVVDAALCIDTLLRGEGHDRALVARIAAHLAPGGALIADVHNARPGYARLDARRGVGTHTRSGFARLLEDSGLGPEVCEPLGFLPAPLAGLPGLGALDRWLAAGLPPIRWLVRARRA